LFICQFYAAVFQILIPYTGTDAGGPKINADPRGSGFRNPVKHFLLMQEMRAKLQADDPEMGFGDLGRRLGEMWHSLTEDEKEDYRSVMSHSLFW
jgi:hypothetical protein